MTQTIKGSQIACFKGSKIGHDVAFAEDVIIRDSDNHTILDKPHEESSRIEIGNHVWIGTNSIILKVTARWSRPDRWSTRTSRPGRWSQAFRKGRAGRRQVAVTMVLPTRSGYVLGKS
jgi:hypothetical protein